MKGARWGGGRHETKWACRSYPAGRGTGKVVSGIDAARRLLDDFPRRVEKPAGKGGRGGDSGEQAGRKWQEEGEKGEKRTSEILVEKEFVSATRARE